jgi:hypothetical protein
MLCIPLLMLVYSASATLRRNDEDCASYYDETGILHYCEPGFLFDPDTNLCDYSSNVHCRPPATDAYDNVLNHLLFFCILLPIAIVATVLDRCHRHLRQNRNTTGNG